MSKYHAQVTRSDRFWLVHVPELNRTTQARNLPEVEVMARDLVAVMENVDPATVDITFEVQLPGHAREHWKRSKELREEADRIKAKAAEEARTAARELAETGVTVRDIGKLLGVSFQRAGQLVKAA
jgi:hypothetical protein